jgi:DNA invertase Pin-like site-specific DNA recombinase
MSTYGYARVSTIGQTLAVQEAALHQAGAAKVFKEKISGAANHRAQLDRLLKTIDAGDLVIITRLDKGPAQHSRPDREGGRDIQITRGHLGRHDHGPRPLDAHGSRWLAEFERELIRVRTGEGRIRAKARGVHMGRPFKLARHQQGEAIARLDAGEALTDIARTFGVHHTTIGRLRA